jgi:hypothetical protein
MQRLRSGLEFSGLCQREFSAASKKLVAPAGNPSALGVAGASGEGVREPIEAAIMPYSS